jgi:hypothetical protein
MKSGILLNIPALYKCPEGVVGIRKSAVNEIKMTFQIFVCPYFDK